MLSRVRSDLRLIGRAVGPWVRWWPAELLGMLPAGWRKALRLGRDEWVLRVAADFCRLERRGVDETETVARWSCDAGEPAAISGAMASGVAKLVLELDAPGQILTRDVLLPIAAAENLDEVVGYELDRHTPFTSAQVYYGVRPLERRLSTGQVRVRLAVVQRSVLEGWLARVERWGWHPERVTTSADPELNLLPADLRHRPFRLPGPAAVLSGIIVVLMLLLVATPFQVMRDVNRSLHAELRSLQPLALEVERLRERRAELEEERLRLVHKRLEYPPLTDALSELAAVMPDHAWLSSLEISGPRVVLNGQSRAAAGLIAHIESSPFFEDSRFAAPVSRDRAGMETFRVNLDLVTRDRVDRLVSGSPADGGGADRTRTISQ